MRYEAPEILTIGAAATLVRGGTDSANDCCTCGKQNLFVGSEDDDEEA